MINIRRGEPYLGDLKDTHLQQWVLFGHLQFISCKFDKMIETSKLYNLYQFEKQMWANESSCPSGTDVGQ